MSILSLQTASPTFKNDGFTMEILTFLKNQSFVLENWFGYFLALFLADFGWSVSFWETGLGAFWRFLGDPEALLNVEIGLTDAKNLA